MNKKQECIPVGCVPSAAVAVSWGGVPLGDLPRDWEGLPGDKGGGYLRTVKMLDFVLKDLGQCRVSFAEMVMYFLGGFILISRLIHYFLYPTHNTTKVKTIQNSRAVSNSNCAKAACETAGAQPP